MNVFGPALSLADLRSAADAPDPSRELDFDGLGEDAIQGLVAAASTDPVVELLVARRGSMQRWQVHEGDELAFLVGVGGASSAPGRIIMGISTSALVHEVLAMLGVDLGPVHSHVLTLRTVEQAAEAVITGGLAGGLPVGEHARWWSLRWRDGESLTLLRRPDGSLWEQVDLELRPTNSRSVLLGLAPKLSAHGPPRAQPSP